MKQELKAAEESNTALLQLLQQKTAAAAAAETGLLQELHKQGQLVQELRRKIEELQAAPPGSRTGSGALTDPMSMEKTASPPGTKS